MKKFIGVLLIAACMLLLCGCELYDFFFGTDTLKARAENHLNISLNDATVIEEWDNHGGFHGDGMTFIKLSCPDGFESRLNAADQKSEWKALPISNSDGSIYEYYYEWGGLFENPETEERLIPDVKNGYWFFKDTGAMNWDFGLYDCDENLLYYYEYDS